MSGYSWRPRLGATGLGLVLAVLLGLAFWAVNRKDGGRDALAGGTGGGAGSSVTGAGASSLSPSAGLASATPDAIQVSGSPTGVASATGSPGRPSASPSPARSATPPPAPAGLTAAFRQRLSWNGGYQAE